MTKSRKCNEKYFKLIPKEGDIEFQEEKKEKSKSEKLSEWHEYLRIEREKDKKRIK